MLRAPALLLALLLLPAAGAALLDDATGDVTARHFEQAYTPVPGWDAMDLVSLDIEELPDVLRFTVRAAGLESTASYDAGNYFVYVARGQAYYTVRMIQDNQGTAVVSELLVTEGRDVFGTVIANLETSVDTATGAITTDVPRALLIDQDGAVPARGGTLDGIVVSAEAHATGVYTGGFSGLEGGPLIIGDRMPDDWSNTGPAPANITFQYGGGTQNGPVDLAVERPYRASNGEATILVYRVTATNLGDTPQTFLLSANILPEGWELRFPGQRILLEAGQGTTFDAYLRVPFQHIHGATFGAEIKLTSEADPDTWARTEVGIHYLALGQPSGHHSEVFLHSAARAGFTALDSLLGGGDAALYWNTDASDDQDQGLPMSGIGEGDAYTWSGCLTPGLALGITPSTTPGHATLTLESPAPLAGTFTGRLSIAQVERGAYCHEARTWTGPQIDIARFEPVAFTIDGQTRLQAIITPVLNGSIAYEPGMDLLLELVFQPDQPLAYSKGLTLLPGGRLTLPLLDHHDPAPIVLPGDNGTIVAAPEVFVPEPTAEVESPGIGASSIFAVLAAGLMAVHQRRA